MTYDTIKDLVTTRPMDGDKPLSSISSVESLRDPWIEKANSAMKGNPTKTCEIHCCGEETHCGGPKNES